MNENSPIFDLKIQRNDIGDLLEQSRKKQEFTDVKLKIGDKLFHAHRNILSLYSPVLKAMISDQWSKEGICEISDEYVDVEIMEDLLSFLYTGSVKLTPDNVHSFCVAAHFLQISNLLEASVKQLCKQISTENVLTLFIFSISCQLEILRKSCLRFIQAEHEKVFQESMLLKLSFDNFKDLIKGLKDQAGGFLLRENTFHCIVRWAETEASERSDKLSILLENIPLEELSFEFFTQTVSTHKLVIESFSCAQALIKTFGKFQTIFNRSSSPSTIKKQNLIVIGGEMNGRNTTSSMSHYCAETGVWKKLPDMKESKSHFAATVNDKQELIVCGGYVNSTGTSTDSVQMFDWSAQAWKELPKLPLRLGSTSMAIHEGLLYVAGGDIDNGNRLSTVLCYSFETQQWKNVKSMHVARADSHLIAFGNHLYAIGGATKVVEKYDSLLDEWTKVASMNKSHKWFGATVHLDKFYVCGQMGFEMYDPKKNVWTVLQNPLLGLGTSLVSLNGKLLAVGGRNEEDLLKSDSIFEFDFPSDQWKEFCKMNSKIGHHCSLVGEFN